MYEVYGSKIFDEIWVGKVGWNLIIVYRGEQVYRDLCSYGEKV